MKNIELIKKIHAGADDTCYSSILTVWEKNSQYKQLEKLMELLCKGVDLVTAASKLDINQAYARYLLKISEKIKEEKKNENMYDHMFTTSEFLDQCEEMIEEGVDDVYFSLNSFYQPKRIGDNVRHINAFVLDFDFYKDERYKGWEPRKFYTRKIKNKLPFTPTAVVDSGRGLYIIYAFRNCSYHMEGLYRAIMKAFYTKFEALHVDAAAMLITQVVRLPGSINSRSGRMVTILEYEDTDYMIQDFSSLLTWSREDVKKYKLDCIKRKKTEKTRTAKSEKKDISGRKPYFKDFYEDLRQLIIMRNRKGMYEGYREVLIYLLRERAVWSGYSIKESIEMATELNDEFHLPLSMNEIENVCRPSEGRNTTSISTIIDKLKITLEEQKKLKILKRKWLKKSLYAKRKRKNKLTNLTEKQQELMERRTRVCELKNVQHLRNHEIADMLGVSRSQVTRDMRFIKCNPAKFKILLKEYMDRLLEKKETDDYRLRQTYQRQQELKNWLTYANSALEFLVQELEVT